VHASDAERTTPPLSVFDTRSRQTTPLTPTTAQSRSPTPYVNMHVCHGGAVVRTSLMRRLMREARVKGGVILFRGSGAAARRYVEADRSRADEYYLGADDAVAEYTVLDSRGEVTA